MSEITELNITQLPNNIIQMCISTNGTIIVVFPVTATSIAIAYKNKTMKGFSICFSLHAIVVDRSGIDDLVLFSDGECVYARAKGKLYSSVDGVVWSHAIDVPKTAYGDDTMRLGETSDHAFTMTFYNDGDDVDYELIQYARVGGGNDWERVESPYPPFISNHKTNPDISIFMSCYSTNDNLNIIMSRDDKITRVNFKDEDDSDSFYNDLVAIVQDDDSYTIFTDDRKYVLADGIWRKSDSNGVHAVVDYFNPVADPQNICFVTETCDRKELVCDVDGHPLFTSTRKIAIVKKLGDEIFISFEKTRHLNFEQLDIVSINGNASEFLFMNTDLNEILQLPTPAFE